MEDLFTSAVGKLRVNEDAVNGPGESVLAEHEVDDADGHPREDGDVTGESVVAELKVSNTVDGDPGEDGDATIGHVVAKLKVDNKERVGKVSDDIDGPGGSVAEISDHASQSTTRSVSVMALMLGHQSSRPSTCSGQKAECKKQIVPVL